MRKQVVKLAVIIFLILSFQLTAQDMPLVYAVENTGAECPVPYMPSISELPKVESLPDPFQWSDGRGRISNYSDWRYRRAEIKSEIEHYEIGEKPIRPEDITASFSDSDNILTVNITVNGKTLVLTSKVVLPSGDGPYPVVIGIGFGFNSSGSLPADIFTSRNIAAIGFSHDHVSTYGNPQTSDPYFQLYPDLNPTNVGQYSAWSWGVSRLIDGLELVQDDLPIDLKHIAVTGCSYAGKAALFAGALDERIALTIAQESGGGGYTTWRYSEVINRTTGVETLSKTDYNWFKNSMKDFSSSVSKLPEDHHELMAMVAPRALLVTGNPDFVWLADESGYVGSKGVQEVYNALGVPDRFGYSIVGGHGHCQLPGVQYPEVGAFVDKFLLGDTTVNTDVSRSPYNTDLSPWITWDTPELSAGTSYFGKTSLVYPEDLQEDMDTSLTFLWNKVDDAENYIFQLSTNPTFTENVSNDSVTDTSKTINGLAKGTRYYWRVQVKSSSGSGPWSNQRNFITDISAPGVPQLVSVTPYPNRSDYVTLTWGNVKYASSYHVQLSELQSFISVVSSATTPDTAKALNGTAEGHKYYWRVQARNISGSGPWSDIADFTLILPPTNLKIQRTSLGDVIIDWDDNSSVEEGYVIERKQSIRSSYSVIDTIGENSESYTDLTALWEGYYIYRIKAYLGDASSNYSNEAFWDYVGVEENLLGVTPTEYYISQNYPNPFNPTTKIKFALPVGGMTKLIIYDLLGREMATLINKDLNAGYHEINVDVKSIDRQNSSGVYFYSIQSGEFTQTRKMILMK